MSEQPRSYEWDCPNCGEHISTNTLPPPFAAQPQPSGALREALERLAEAERLLRGVLPLLGQRNFIGWPGSIRAFLDARPTGEGQKEENDANT